MRSTTDVSKTTFISAIYLNPQETRLRFYDPSRALRQYYVFVRKYKTQKTQPVLVLHFKWTTLETSIAKCTKTYFENKTFQWVVIITYVFVHRSSQFLVRTWISFHFGVLILFETKFKKRSTKFVRVWIIAFEYYKSLSQSVIGYLIL